MTILVLTSLLFLGHFLADFVLQTESLVNWKYRSVLGLSIHALIHFVVNFLLLVILFQPSLAALAAALISLAHGFIDQLKIFHENRKHHHLIAFWIDQFLHWLVLCLAIWLISKTSAFADLGPLAGSPAGFGGHFIYNPTLIFYLILVIFSAKTLEISNFQKEKDKHKNAKIVFNYQRILRRLFYLTLVFLLILSILTI